MKFRFYSALALISLSIMTAVEAKVTRTLIKEGIHLKPNQTFMYNFDSKNKAEISWKTTQENKCKNHCIRATRIFNSGGSHHLETTLGGGQIYDPEDGKIKIEYKNIGNIDVVIDLYSSKRSCDAEACTVLKNNGVKDPSYFEGKNTEYKQIRVKSFEAVETSIDQSYAQVRGESIFGKHFDIIIVFWLIDKHFDGVCVGLIDNYFSNPRSDWGPYHISGSVIKSTHPPVMKIEGCSPKAKLSERTQYDL